MNREEATARCWVEVNLDTIRGNYRRACARVKGSEVICVLKGNAYGMGAPEVCRALMDAGAKRFAVASGDEAEELLRTCPRAEVLILGFVGAPQAARLIRMGAVFTAFSLEQGRTLAQTAKDCGTPARIHVKADTGLYRLGFSGPEAARDILSLKETGWLRLEGCFTHLALHDRASDERQFARLDALLKDCAALGLTFECVHALDSIGMVRYPERRMDAVRTGAWLYGVTPSRFEEPGQCLLAAGFHARIAQLHAVAKGELIGYDDDHPLARDSRIATVTAGYVDGVPRLNNAGAVMVRGLRAPVVGLVCMDQMMVDVTDIPDARPGDVVTFLGDGIGLNEYASWLKLNRNEALARIGRRVTRVYRQGDREWYVNELRA